MDKQTYMCQLKKNTKKTEAEWMLLKYHSVMSIIGEILVSESKREIRATK